MSPGRPAEVSNTAMAHDRLEALVRSAQSGGTREVQAFLSEARPSICRWALMWTGSPDTAEDIAQKVLMKVHRSLSEYRPGSARAWLYRISRNAFLDWERRRGTDRRLRDRLSLERLADEVTREDGIDTGATTLLMQLVDDLSPRQRAVLDLVDLQGFEPSEVAEMLDLAPETVRVHLHRARKALRGRCSELEIVSEPLEVTNG